MIGLTVSGCGLVRQREMQERIAALQDPLPKARQRAVETIIEGADKHAAHVLPIIQELKRAGINTLRDIAEALNTRREPTARKGGQWSASTVRNVLARAWAASGPVSCTKIGNTVNCF